MNPIGSHFLLFIYRLNTLWIPIFARGISMLLVYIGDLQLVKKSIIIQDLDVN